MRSRPATKVASSRPNNPKCFTLSSKLHDEAISDLLETQPDNPPQMTNASTPGHRDLVGMSTTTPATKATIASKGIQPNASLGGITGHPLSQHQTPTTATPNAIVGANRRAESSAASRLAG